MTEKRENLSKEELVDSGTISKELINKVEKMIIDGSSILITGQTGTGKTTMLNSLIELVPENKVVLSVKDPYGELNIHREDEVYYIDEDSEDLYSKALSMAPDVFVINESTKHNIYDFTKTLFCGLHGFTTLHASDADSALERIYWEIPEEVSHEDKLNHIKYFDLVIIMGLESDGEEIRRKVIDVKEVSKDLKKNESGELYIQLIDI